jgi:ankyrin repeat protein
MKNFYLFSMLIALGGFSLVQAQDTLKDVIKVEKSDTSTKKEADDDVLFVQEGEEEKSSAKTYDNFSIAIQSKDYKKIDSYLLKGSNININLYNGNTIVHISAFHRDLDFLLFASERKANLAQLNNNDESILYWAAGGQSVQYLEEARAILGKNFNTLLAKQTKIGRTPLHSAILYSANSDVIKWLIDNKVNMNAKDINGKTALHYAAGMRRWEALEVMLKKGGNINEADDEGKTVEDYIFERMDVLSVDMFYPYVSPAKKLFIEESIGKIFPDKLTKLNPKYKQNLSQLNKHAPFKEEFIEGKEVIK